MNKIIRLIFGCILAGAVQIASGQTQAELGANYNHDPELIELDLLERAGVHWVRVTPRFYRYLSGQLDPLTDEGLQHVIDAKRAGYKVVFGFRFDFKQNSERIPEPGSAREREMFDVASQVLSRIGQHLDIFTLGNEQNLETMNQDMIHQDSHGGIPLVVFTERLLTEVVEPFYELRPDFKRPDIYGGSIPAIFQTSTQNNAAVRGLLQMANDDDRIAGFDLHFHISSFDEVDQGFAFARSILKEKPFIITEFSLHRLYRSKINEKIGVNQAGIEFANKYGYDPEWETYRWYTVVNSNKVEPEELKDFFDTRTWFIPHYLDVYREKFNENGVVLATYPILQQSAPAVLNSGSPLWFLNPVFMQVSLVRNEDGELGANPLCAEDYLEWAAYRNPLSVDEKKNSGLNIYPNPASDKIINIRLTDGLKESFQVKVFDLEGKLCKTEQLEKSTSILNLQELDSGLYIIQVNGKDSFYQQKVLLK